MLANVVTAVLNVNCNGCVSDLQFLKQDAKFTILIFWSNKVDGTEFKLMHALNVDENIVAFILLSNKPVGTDVIPELNENASVNVVAFVDKLNKSDGIDVIPVERMKFEKISTSAKPVPVEGIDVIKLQPKKSTLRNPTLPKLIILLINVRIDELLLTEKTGIKPNIEIVYVPAET
jgi:hypothetical protein